MLFPFKYYQVDNANCTRDSDCVEGEVNFNGHGTVLLHITFIVCVCVFDDEICNSFIQCLIGRRTGRCVQYYNYTFKTCEIQSWCPVEEYAAVR